MGQPMIVGISAIIAFFLVNFIIWFIGHKKASILNRKIAELEETAIALNKSLARSEGIVNLVPELKEEISSKKASEEMLREEIRKLTNSLMTEVQKSASMQEISSKLAKNEISLDGLEKSAIKDKATIEQLSRQITEKELITAENNSILKRLREVFAKD